MKIYEKPSVEIKIFEVEDIMAKSIGDAGFNASLDGVTLDTIRNVGAGTSYGVVFEW